MHHPLGEAVAGSAGGRSETRGLVICIGNSLIADDRAGCAVHEELAARSLPEQVRLELLGLGGLRLLDELDGEEVMVVVDAVTLGGPVGGLHLLEMNELPEAGGEPVTSHDIGLREVMDIARLLYPERMPRRSYLLGIEGRCFDEPGAPMSPEVARAIPGATDRVLRLLETGRGEVAQA